MAVLFRAVHGRLGGVHSPPLTYTAPVIFRETTLFTKQVVERLTDSEYRELQAALLLQPELGDLIPETGGLRKIRWAEARRGKGKRGGLRVIYYWYAPLTLIYLLVMYSKSDRDDLSPREKKTLRKLVSGEFE
jgi:mRNA-degrading endonuclease RelE of RelBE toxin-antitoxin system